MMLPRLRTEDVAYWFFRINGCLNLVNFLVHHERRGHTGTDVDILAVRFPYRRELAMSTRPMIDDPVFDSDGRIDLIICEIKTGLCDLNGPWTDPQKENMHHVLYAIGAFPEDTVLTIAESLYEKQAYVDDNYRVRLFAVGKRRNPTLSEAVIQLTWQEMLSFIYDRFRAYRYEKAQHEQWDRTGKTLFRMVESNREQQDFVDKVIRRMGLEVYNRPQTSQSQESLKQHGLFDFDDTNGGGD